MKAWLLDQLNGIEHLRMADVPDPVAGPGKAVLSLGYAALNPADRYLAQGQYPAKPTLPHILGRDGMGTVIAIGAGVTSFKIGDKAMILRSEIGVNHPGTFAQQAAAPVESLAALPVGWTDQHAAGAALVYLTAHQALAQWGDLEAAVVLITGASGGVGAAAIQLASAEGHTVIALSRSPAKRNGLAKIGAALCLDPNDPSWPAQLKQFLGKRRVDLAIDNIGGSGFNDLIGVMGHGGKISVVGRLAGPVPEFNTATLFFRRLRIGGVAVGDYSPAQSQKAWTEIVETLKAADVKPIVDSVYPFDKIAEAFARLQSGPMGKVLLKM
jgi:NADPH2:quinone reductase